MASRRQETRAGPSAPPPGTAGLGNWEKHTKGIGSRLMQKMGYKPGEGLGKNSDGRVEPIKLKAHNNRAMLGSDDTIKESRRREKDDDDSDEQDEEFLERGRRRRRRRDDLRKRKADSDDEGHGSSSSADDGDKVARFESDNESDREEEDPDSPAYVAKCLMASNQSMINKLRQECQNERAKQSMLEQSLLDYQRELRLNEEIISSHRGVLTVIQSLESIYRNDKLDLANLWDSLTSSISPTTRSHLIQIFALPLLKKQHNKIRLRQSLRQAPPRGGDDADSLDRELEESLYRDMIDVAREWLKTKRCYPALIDWYLEWKTLLKLDQPESSKRTKYFRRKLLDVMHLATLKNERDLNSFQYVPYRDSEDSSSASRNHRRTTREDEDLHCSSNQRGNHDEQQQQPLNFKQLIEQRASDHGLLFRPVSGRSHDSKQVYKLENQTLYIDSKIIFVRKNNEWQARTLDDVINNCS